MQSTSLPSSRKVCDQVCAARRPERVNAVRTALKCEHICIKVCADHPEMIKGGGGREFTHMSHFHYFALVNSQIIDCGSII